MGRAAMKRDLDTLRQQLDWMEPICGDAEVVDVRVREVLRLLLATTERLWDHIQRLERR